MEIPPIFSSQFLLGLNYWPARSAMYWWQHFDKDQLRIDFSRIQDTGLGMVRIFLLWEDFQPQAKKVSIAALDNLVEVAEQAEQHGLKILPSLFTGHMNGLNWLPPWSLWAKERSQTYPVFATGKIRQNLPRNFYEDLEMIEAQLFLLREVSGALQGHAALWAWDLGHNPAHIIAPPDRQAFRIWLQSMTEELRSRDETLPITLGLAGDDLWAEGGLYRLYPEDMADYLDFVSIESEPTGYGFSDGPFDPFIPAFFSILTRWLSKKEVICIGLGFPTEPVLLENWDKKNQLKKSMPSEKEAESSWRAALRRLHQAGINGAFVSAFSDYHPRLWEAPPLDERIYDRFCGIFRHDGMPKRFQPLFKEYRDLAREPVPEEDPQWIDISPEEFHANASDHIHRLYQKYRDYTG